ncbi:lipoprotein signal peptidase [Bacteroidales bacterium OttesenSCG-928-C19]|nr:lipoprotein signal peptidase [Bacteroidales bacterium OttesenSCG-928-C19]
MSDFWKKKAVIPSIIIIGVLLIDQILKIWVKTNMHIGEEIPVFGDWFKLYFVENPGFAFGMTLGGSWGKLILTLFRIVAVCAIGWYIVNISKKGASRIVIASIALIFAGALGNIIDSCFYGLLFSDSNSFYVAEFLPEKGYAPFLYGHVVDMLYFPLIDTYWPNWMPFVGGKHFIFFRPIFNIADSAIFIGVIILLIKVLVTDIKKKKELKDGANSNI